MAFQLGSELLDACVLGIVAQEDSYGYLLTQKLKEVITISDSTLYPVLRRLKKDGLLETYDQSYQGRNRRYYTITLAGKQKLESYLMEWDIFKTNVENTLKGGVSGDKD